MKKKIAYLTGTRADFGIMTPVLTAINQSPTLNLQIYYTGMHLMKEYGQTSKIVKKAFPRSQALPAKFQLHEPNYLAIFFQKCFTQLLGTFSQHRPDLILVMGDRAEMLCAATAALYLHIPVAHVHGGERTSTIDELARHAITKLSHLHFVATAQSALRIKKMGEQPWRVIQVGAPALDTIYQQALPSTFEVNQYLKLSTDQKFLLLTLHPESQMREQAGQHLEQAIKACLTFSLPLVIIYPNADEGGAQMIKVIKHYESHPLCIAFIHIPHLMFLAMIRDTQVWISNSSAGLIESSAFMTPVVNVGKRQLNREHDENVINSSYEKQAIVKAIKTMIRKKQLTPKMSIWGKGLASQKIVAVLEKLVIDDKLMNKQITY